MLPLVVAALAASAMAVPMPAPTPAPDLSKAKAAKRATSCTFSGSDGYSLASVSQKDCATIVLSALTVPSGVTLDLSDLEDDTTVVFEGETSWEYAEWEGPLLQIEGTSITIEGASGAILNGNGQEYWDGEGSNGGVTKPKFFYAHDLTDSTITDLYLYNTPVQAVSINNADGLTITGMTINDEAGDDQGANTDGFDIGDSTNVVISGANVYNQDDCVAINSGTDITVEDSVCSGGHGLSIGSVGGRSDNVVDTVKFINNEVKSSVNGIRIKATEGDTGSITSVTYQEITLQDISKYGILIEQNYDGGDLDGGTPSTGIPITELVLDNISGDDAVESSGYNIVIACGDDACSDWTWTDVDVSGGKTYDDCLNVPSGVSC